MIESTPTRSKSGRIWFIAALIVPVAALVIALSLIAAFPDPLRNSFSSVSSADSFRDTIVRARLSLVVVIEILVITLLARPWSTPWTFLRFFLATIALTVWTGLIGVTAMHNGVLLSWHAIVLFGVLACFFAATCVLALRGLWNYFTAKKNTAPGSAGPQER